MDEILNELRKAAPKGEVHADPLYLMNYSFDATGQEHRPQVVVIPDNEDEVQRILVVAARHGLPVTPRGAGVGYSGGALPLNGGLLLGFTRMNRIWSIDRHAMTAEVDPGVVTQDLAMACEERGLFYPPDPASLKTSTIGGNVAENAGGPRCFKYGVTGRYVLRIRGFLVDGTPIRFGSMALKDVAGYSLRDLLVGSEGTLAVITRIWLRLLPRPASRRLWKIDFPNLEEAAAFLRSIVSAGISPSVLEFMDRSSLEASSAYIGMDLPRSVGASLLVELDGEPWEIDRRRLQLQELLGPASPCHVQEAASGIEMERLWQLRRAVSPAISRIKPRKINEDVAVPPQQIPQAVKRFHEMALERGVLLVLFGHFGDGNIHTNLMVDPADPEEMARAELLLQDIFRYVIELGGTLSGEHGIGLSKKAFMPLQFSPAEIDLMRRVKTAFDPENRLNPGKMF